MPLTSSQQNAVDVRDRTLLVSAAAGSGKTYTLTQRIIKAIIEDGQDLSRLLIVTFTRAAAGELKAKISKALGEAIAAHPENIHLQKQLIKLGQAHISTIDSFFSEPVRANFEKLGLPAAMRLADDSELAPIRDKIMSEVLDGFFEKCIPYANTELSEVGYGNRYTELMGIISGARDTSNVLPTFFDIYRKLMTSPMGLEQLQLHSKRLYENSRRDFFETLEGKILKDELLSSVRYVWRTFVKCSDEMQSDPFTASKYTADFTENAELCHILLSAIENGNYDTVKEAFEAFKPARITSVSSKEKTETSEYYKNLRSELNKNIKDIANDRLCLSGEELSALFSAYSEMCGLLCNILVKFDQKYGEEKRHKGICEFADMPKFMLRLLLDTDGNPTEYAKMLQESFDEVYIDEYQDVNEIQDRIFELIGNEHRFMVGDIKQSIYGFREAEPAIFAGYRKKFPLYDKENSELGKDGSTIFMSENFRCDENVIDFTNLVCRNVFSAFSESIGYTPSDDLKFGKGKPYENYQSPHVVLNIVETSEKSEDGELECEGDDSDGTKKENAGNLGDEAVIVANEIAELIRNGKNADGSPLTAGNIAVLVRSHVYTKPLISALSALNIKYALSSKGELFETEDMRILTDLLSVIDNPRDDVPLCHVLTADSDIYTRELTLEEVIRIRKNADSSLALYDALMLYAENGENTDIAERSRSFISVIEKLREASGRMSADKLVRALASIDRYFPLTLTDAYTYLYDSACRFVKNTWSSLYGFIGYFKDVMERGEAGAEPDTKVGDAVRIMSIHQSKGLEFNVCFLFGFGKQFNMQNRYSLIFHKDLGPYMKLRPTVTGDIIQSISTRYETNPIYKTADKYIKQKCLEEEARIFYVALTRARERLYISATLPKSFEEYTSKLKASADMAYEIKKSRSYINWILLTLLTCGSVNELLDIRLCVKGEASLTSPFQRVSGTGAHRKATDEELLFSSLLNSHSEQYGNTALLSSIPSKVAASKVSPHMLDDSVFTPIPNGILFSDEQNDIADMDSENEARIRAHIELMRSAKKDFDSLLEVNKKPTSAERGTATHAFLQFCDYRNVDKNGIEAEIIRLKKQKFITKRTAEIIRRRELEGFFKSELYSLIRNAKNVRREFHFGMFRSASDFTENDDLRGLLSDKKIYVQGSVDLIIECENGEIVICDYKTDRISADEKNDRELLIHNMKEKHGEQLSQYSHAVERIFAHKPDRIFIYSLPLGEAVEIM